MLGVYWHARWQSYETQLSIEPLSSPQDDLPYQGPDFREAIDAAADWLDGSVYHGRDGTWAAHTLRSLTKELPLQ